MYCVNCRKKEEVINEKTITLQNGRKARQGECKKCGTTMIKIGIKQDE